MSNIGAQSQIRTDDFTDLQSAALDHSAICACKLDASLNLRSYREDLLPRYLPAYLLLLLSAHQLKDSRIANASSV